MSNDSCTLPDSTIILFMKFECINKRMYFE